LFCTCLIELKERVEVHPYCRQMKLRAFCSEKGIQLCAYSPLGGTGTPWANNYVMDSPVLKQIAREMGKTVAQVTLGASAASSNHA
jgi:diketogulonate reductase-like aldo/keto reductase